MKMLLVIAMLAVAPVTLKPAEVSMPDDEAQFAGPNADLLNANCLACHSTSMVLLQPRMNEKEWTASVAKMRTVYKAPIEDADAAKLPAALAALQTQVSSKP